MKNYTKSTGIKLKSNRTTKLHGVSIFFLITIFFLLTSDLVNAQSANFSGDWTRNTEKTDAGGLSINSIPILMTVTQTAGSISIKRISKHANGDTLTYAEQLNFDGSTTASSPKQNMKKTASMQWATDQKSFTETANYTDDNGNPIQSFKETWELTDGGKNLKITAILEGGGNTYNIQEVFDKQ